MNSQLGELVHLQKATFTSQATFQQPQSTSAQPQHLAKSVLVIVNLSFNFISALLCCILVDIHENPPPRQQPLETTMQDPLVHQPYSPTSWPSIRRAAARTSSQQVDFTTLGMFIIGTFVSKPFDRIQGPLFPHNMMIFAFVPFKSL